MYLNAHSWFSLKYGVLSPEKLLQEAVARGLMHVALTDINCSAGLSEFFRLTTKERTYPVHPIAGIDFRLGMRQLYIGLARNNDGLHQLNGALSDHLLDGESLPEEAPEMPDAFIIYPFGARNIPPKLRSNEFIGIRPVDLNRLRFARNPYPREKCVALTSATFRNKADHNTHRLLRAMHNNTLHTKLTVHDIAPLEERFMASEEVMRAYADAPELLLRTQEMLEQCEVDLAFDRTKNRRTWSGDRDRDRRLLRQLADNGLHHRYSDPSPEVFARLEKELSTVEMKDFVSYFLINWDLVRFAKAQGFFHVGRGSGANSLVAYCLGITDVDPIELDLYFERFINPARDKPPDFDIDFSWKDRDCITARLFEKYGEGRRVALLATYSTFQERAIINELGKVFGLPPSEIAALSDGDADQPRWIGKGDRLDFGARTSAPAKGDPIVEAIRRYAPRLKHMPAHLSIHVGGVLISEKPITYFTALHLPPKGFATTQFSMIEAEDLGLYKFDILSQRGLGHIRDAMGMVEQRTGERIDIHDVKPFMRDPLVKEMLRTGNTIGCFYVESPAMRMLMKKMQVHDYKGLVAASSIIRPGVSHSGMMREYLMRYHDPERRKLAPKKLLDIMPETFGVMVYQEDVIKVGYEYAGLTLTEADSLRRSMSGKFRNRKEFGEVRESFFRGALERGNPLPEVKELWEQIVSFGDFSFAKGHSASYAVESYQSLYLKAHHPLEFLVAVSNNFGGFYHTEFYLHEAKRMGATVEAPCVNTSEDHCSLHGTRIFLGLRNIRSLEESAALLILSERRRQGPYIDLQDLLRRVPLGMEQTRVLVRSGALRFTGRSKPHLLWDLVLLHRPASVDSNGDLFITKIEEPRLPELQHYPLADSYDEMELLGFPLCDPFTLIRYPEKSPGAPLILKRDMDRSVGKRVSMLGYLIHVKTTHTYTGADMTFGSFIDTAGDFWDSAQFPDVAARYSFNKRGVYMLTGVIEQEFGHAALRTQYFEKLPWIPDPRYGNK